MSVRFSWLELPYTHLPIRVLVYQSALTLTLCAALSAAWAQTVAPALPSPAPADHAQDSSMLMATALAQRLPKQDAQVYVQLRQQAQQAHAVNPASAGQGIYTYGLWRELLRLQPQDALAQQQAAQVALGLAQSETDLGHSYWFERMNHHFRALLALHPDMADFWLQWGDAQALQARHAQRLKAPWSQLTALWNASSSHYLNALKLNPQLYAAANNRGTLLIRYAQAAEPHSNAQGMRIWQTAIEQLSQAVAMKTENEAVALGNLAFSRSEAAELVAALDDQHALKLYEQANQDFERTLALRPEHANTVENWGVSLLKQGQLFSSRNPELAGQRYAQAIGHFEALLQQKPLWRAGVVNLAIAQFKWAELMADTQFERAQHLLARAQNGLTEHIRNNPRDLDAIDNLGVSLVIQYRLKQPVTDPGLMDQPLERAMGLYERATGFSDAFRRELAYNLACVYALAGRVSQAVDLLAVANHEGSLHRNYASDPDLDGIRDTPQYQAWLKTLMPKNSAAPVISIDTPLRIEEARVKTPIVGKRRPGAFAAKPPVQRKPL